MTEVKQATCDQMLWRNETIATSVQLSSFMISWANELWGVLIVLRCKLDRFIKCYNNVNYYIKRNWYVILTEYLLLCSLSMISHKWQWKATFKLRLATFTKDLNSFAVFFIIAPIIVEKQRAAHVCLAIIELLSVQCT